MIRTLPLVLGILIGTAGYARWKDSFTHKSGPSQPRKQGTVFFDRWRAQPGLNVVQYLEGGSCQIMNLEGEKLAALPGNYCLFLPGGQYFTVLNGPRLFDKNFNLLWERPDLRQHHEALYDKERDWIWLLVDQTSPLFGEKRVVHDTIIALDRLTGKEKFSWGIYENRAQIEKFLNRPWKLDYWEPVHAHIFSHMNSLSILPPGRQSQGGEILVSENYLFYLMIINIETKQITWKMNIGGPNGQHGVHFYGPDDILLFINSAGPPENKNEPKNSSVAHIDPRVQKITWEYADNPKTEFYGEILGHVQPLDNGNMLVTHITHGGAAFEITPEGRLVWEWNGRTVETGDRDMIYRITRQSAETLEPFLHRALMN